MLWVVIEEITGFAGGVVTMEVAVLEVAMGVLVRAVGVSVEVVLPRVVGGLIEVVLVRILGVLVEVILVRVL